jgi:hypothetical protein
LGNGDPTLNLFGDESAPNARALARQFSTVDNFYANAEVSAQGWNWVVAANSNPFSEQGWPAVRPDRQGHHRPEGQRLTTSPVWIRAARCMPPDGPSRSWRTDRLVGIAGT